MSDAVEAQQVEGKAAQQGEEAGDAAGILAHGDIPEVVETVLNAPVGPDGLSSVGRR